jgi:hypothetical protein
MSGTTFADLTTHWHWKPIPDCPGRFVLSPSPSHLTPADLLGPGIEVREVEVDAARDTVIIGAFAGGGLISYRRATGDYVHTLNTPEGFARKLLALGIPLPSHANPPS